MRCSVVIPAYNSERTITCCLKSTLNQSLSAEEYEVIIVDDGSTDDTRKIAEGYPVRVLIQQNRGPATARNNGAKQAKGDILVFTDSDCELNVNFLEKIIAPIEQNPEIVGVQGSYQTRQKGFIPRFVQAEIETRYKKMIRNEYTDFIGTYAAAYKRNVFCNNGGFDVGFPSASGEDTEFSYNLHRNGYKMVFEPEAFVYHQHPSKLSDYLRIKFYRGYWRVRLYSKHPSKTFNDSYTPQSLKLQVLSVPLVFFFVSLSFFNVAWLLVLFLILFSFLLFSASFFRLFSESKYTMCIFTPVMLFLRASSIFWGILFGLFNHLISRQYTSKLQESVDRNT